MQVQPRTMTAEHEPRGTLEQFKQDVSWFQDHYDELLQHYPEQWVAILNERVIGAATDVDDLLTQIKQAGFSPARAVVKHLTAKEELFILLAL